LRIDRFIRMEVAGMRADTFAHLTLHKSNYTKSFNILGFFCQSAKKHYLKIAVRQT
jgi:hypothetical protein